MSNYNEIRLIIDFLLIFYRKWLQKKDLYNEQI